MVNKFRGADEKTVRVETVVCFVDLAVLCRWHGSQPASKKSHLVASNSHIIMMCANQSVIFKSKMFISGNEWFWGWKKREKQNAKKECIYKQIIHPSNAHTLQYVKMWSFVMWCFAQMYAFQPSIWNHFRGCVKLTVAFTSCEISFVQIFYLFNTQKMPWNDFARVQMAFQRVRTHTRIFFWSVAHSSYCVSSAWSAHRITLT